MEGKGRLPGAKTLRCRRGCGQAEQARGAAAPGFGRWWPGGLSVESLPARAVTVTFPRSQPPTTGPHPGFSPLEPPTFPRGPGAQEGAGLDDGVCVAAEGTRGFGYGQFNIPTAGRTPKGVP